MSITKTLGGDRIGTGKKMKVTMHGYERSTHNLSRKVTTAMSCGTLVPIYCKPALNGDKWEINLDALVKTIPTIGPLFGSFKFQVDFYKVPIRLYQGILHNNPLNIGLNMKMVHLPKIKIETTTLSVGQGEFDQIASNALLRYLGVSGCGTWSGISPQTISPKFNAVPVLAYYDIFKNYYANKQETNAYVISANEDEKTTIVTQVVGIDVNGGSHHYTNDGSNTFVWEDEDVVMSKLIIYGEGLNADSMQLNSDNVYDLVGDGYLQVQENTPSRVQLLIIDTNNVDPYTFSASAETYYTQEIALKSFALENIDTMRMRLLSSNTLGAEYVIDKSYDLAPYNLLTKVRNNGTPFNFYSQNGLVVKTYQSDIFNNWLKTEWIDGENGIAAITAVDTSSGSFTLDALNLSQKIYNMMNRIAVGGGTYEDWQEAVYDVKTIRKAETPMYIGGMSSEIAFEEVVATSETLVGEDTTKLGTLAGKGTLLGKRAGHIEVSIEEPCFIMGIASITPRVSYYQGNEWYMTELDSIDDLHKPELDGIGFQDLITERMAWWDAQWAANLGGGVSKVRKSAGKQPAWMEYMTDVDVVFSDFADNKKAGYMVLKRDYTPVNEVNVVGSKIEDLTTYIDPSKYNLAFAYQELDAQNFWVQINCDIKCRRKMSARIIPNL